MSLLFTITVTVLELKHIFDAISRVELYSQAELRASYMQGVNRLSNMQIAFANIFSWFAIFFTIISACMLNKLVHACQDLRSNVLVVLGYDKQIGAIFHPKSAFVSQMIQSDSYSSSYYDHESNSNANGPFGDKVPIRRKLSSKSDSYSDVNEFFFKIQNDSEDDHIKFNDSFGDRPT